ncbi:MAG TPA: hypothetical protein VGS58_07015 [Candidatus Sulfopaludibacter sp.]|nr:hypothetical protein [Candidatus Sulfopaludibacter sp.]
MRAGILAGVSAIALGQSAAPGQFTWLYTFGSKEGIHPPTILNRRLARAALGQGENPYGLLFPVAVASDLHGRVWITDGGTRSVHVFDLAGRTYREIRRAGDVLLEQPSGIVSDSQGRVFVADSGGGIFVFDENGEFDRWMVKRGSGLLAGPTALALSENERTIFVADPPRNAIVALNREGEVNETISLPAELREPADISVVHNQICVLGSQQHRAAMFSPGGWHRGELRWEGVHFPSAFTYDAARRRFLVATPRWTIVQIFDEEGQNLGVFGQQGEAVDQTERIDFVHVDREGRVYVVDSRHGKVLVFAER